MADLNERELARAKEMKRQWLEAFGDDEFIRQAYQAGWIRGWRDVKSVRLLTDEEIELEEENAGRPSENGCPDS